MDKSELIFFANYLQKGDFLNIIYGLRQGVTTPKWYIEPLVCIKRVSKNRYKLLAANEDSFFNEKYIVQEIINNTPEIKHNLFYNLLNNNTLDYNEVSKIINNLQSVINNSKSIGRNKLYKYLTYDKNVAEKKRDELNKKFSQKFVETIETDIDNFVINNRKTKKKI